MALADRRMPRRRRAAGQREVAAILRAEPDLAGRIAQPLLLDEHVAELRRARGADIRCESAVADDIDRRERRLERWLRRAAGQSLLLPREARTAGGLVAVAGAHRRVELTK